MRSGVAHGAMEVAAKKALSWCGGATSSCPGSYPKAICPESVASVANDKGDYEMIPGAVHRLICLTAEETPGKPQLGDLE